jgi:hypothetical protein
VSRTGGFILKNQAEKKKPYLNLKYRTRRTRHKKFTNFDEKCLLSSKHEETFDTGKIQDQAYQASSTHHATSIQEVDGSSIVYGDYYTKTSRHPYRTRRVF